jgi:hypothetical protein
MKNWVYYMREGIKNMWKKKVVPDYRTAEREWRKKDAIELLEEIDPQIRKDENENN